MSVTIAGEPTSIKDALNLPGEEVEAWEHTGQTEWQDMVNHDIFRPPESPPSNTHILKMGTTLHSTKKSDKISEWKVHIQ